MKKFYFLISLSLASLLGVNIANATVHIVTVQNSPSHFLPVTVNAVVGDTIRWIWVVGNHIVGPRNASDIPAGAAMFYATVDAGNPLEYVVTVPGNYRYDCHPITPHGEDAYIVVTGVTGISSLDNAPVSSVYPNPFTNKITIETQSAETIALYNMTGQKIKSVEVKAGETKTELDVADLTEGIYFYAIVKEGLIVETRKLVKN